MKLELFSFSLNDIFDKKIQDISGYLVYKISNNITNQHYIGSTKLSILKRFVDIDHFNHSHKTQMIINKNHLYRSINKYGIDNFTVDILHICRNKDTMYRLEKFYIYYFDSFNNGFNNSIDGRGDTRKLSEYMKDKWKNDSQYRSKMKSILKDSLRKYLENPKNKAQYSELCSRRMYEYYSDPSRYTNIKKLKKINDTIKKNKNHNFRSKVSIGLKNKYINDSEYRKYVIEKNTRINKDPNVISKQQKGKINKIIEKLEENNLSMCEENYNKFIKKGVCGYKTAIFKYPELFNNIEREL